MHKRLLLIKMSSLGDVVHALPAVADAVAQGWQVDWVVEESFADIPRLLPGVEQVIPIAWRRWRQNLAAARAEMQQFRCRLRQQRYDLVLDAQGLIKSAVVALLAQGSRAGYSHTSAREPWAAFAYHHRHQVATGQHAIDRQRQLFAAALDYPLPIAATPPVLSDADDEAVPQTIFFLHGTTWDSKHWPPDMWLELARMAAQHGYRVALTWGSEAERQRAEYIGRVEGVQVLAKMSLADLAMVLQKASLVVGVDSGLTHLSAVLGTPTLGLYGATSAVLTGCRGAQAAVLQASTSCSPCVQAQCRQFVGEPLRWRHEVVNPPCFATLPPEQVWQQCQAMLGHQRHHLN